MLSSLIRIPTKLKHKKLPDSMIEAKPVVIEGVSFTSKYIGMSRVDSPKGEEMAAGAIKRIVTANKADTKESPLIMLTVSPKGIQIKDISTEEVIENIDITRISYCTADKAVGKVFGYVVQNPKTESFECHAYMCGSRKQAQKLALTVAQSFSIAYEVSNTKKNENMVEEDYEEPTFSGSNRENNKISNIYHSVADSRYKRLSDSFTSASGSQPLPVAFPNEDETSLSPPTSLNLTQLDSSSSTFPINNFSTTTGASKKKSDDVMVTIMPPPSAKNKTSGSRVTPRSTPTGNLINISAAFEERNQQQPKEADNVDFDFAQLALSRTQETS